MWYLTSSGSKSLTVDPSSTLPCREMAPVANSSASATVVFPDPLCPTRAMLRIPLAVFPAWPATFGEGAESTAVICAASDPGPANTAPPGKPSTKMLSPLVVCIRTPHSHL